MRFLFFFANPSSRNRLPAPAVRPRLELLEDRCLPSVNMMPASVPVAAPPSASTPLTAVNTIASLSHDQIHGLQSNSQQQSEIATIRLEVEEIALGLLQQFAPQLPQAQSAIAFLTSAIPAQQATVNTLQNQTNLLNQLDDLQDQGLILNAGIQNATALLPLLQQLGDMQAVNTLQSTIAADEMTVQSLQPQIAAVEMEVSAFVG